MRMRLMRIDGLLDPRDAFAAEIRDRSSPEDRAACEQKELNHIEGGICQKLNVGSKVDYGKNEAEATMPLDRRRFPKRHPAMLAHPFSGPTAVPPARCTTPLIWTILLAVSIGLFSHPVRAEDTAPQTHYAQTHKSPEKRPWWIVRKEDLVIPNETRIGTTNGRAWLFALLSRVEPYRYVPAEDWYSPYCLHWDDGSIQCKRDKVEDEPKCAPVPGIEVKHGGDRDLIICSKFDRKRFEAICGFSIESNAQGIFTCDIAPNGEKQCEHQVFIKSEDYKGSTREADVSPNNPFWPKYFISGDGTLPHSNTKDRHESTGIICNRPQFISR